MLALGDVHTSETAAATTKHLQNPESEDELSILFIGPAISSIISQVSLESWSDIHRAKLASRSKSPNGCHNEDTEVGETDSSQYPSGAASADGMVKTAENHQSAACSYEHDKAVGKVDCSPATTLSYAIKIIVAAFYDFILEINNFLSVSIIGELASKQAVVVIITVVLNWNSD